MMKNVILFAVSLIFLSLSSCKKPGFDVDEEPIERKECLLTETVFNENGNTGKILYTYDEDKRVVNVRYEDGSETTVYEYNTNEIVETIVRTEGRTTITYTLDGNNNRVSSSKLVTTIPNRPNTESTFSYDGQGYLIEIVTKDLSTNNTSSDKYAYSNGNLTEFDNGTFRFGYFYDTNIPYQGSFFMPVRNSGYPRYYFHVLKKYMGKPSLLLSTGVAQGSFLSNFNFQIDENLNIVGMYMGNLINYTISQKYNCSGN